MVLRRKPDALSNVLPTCPTLREKPEYQGQDKLPVIVWMMAQVVIGNPVLAKEATSLAVTENIDCCKHWENVYKEILDASVLLLVGEWKEHSVKISSSPSNALTLNGTMKSFRLKNEDAITEGTANGSLHREADKSCKVISGRLFRGSVCLKGRAIIFVVLAAAAVLYSNHEATTELKNLGYLSIFEFRWLSGARTPCYHPTTSTCGNAKYSQTGKKLYVKYKTKYGIIS
ncbi:hypothetical protein YC2023_091942 [Brassica napus]